LPQLPVQRSQSLKQPSPGLAPRVVIFTAERCFTLDHTSIDISSLTEKDRQHYRRVHLKTHGRNAAAFAGACGQNCSRSHLTKSISALGPRTAPNACKRREERLERRPRHRPYYTEGGWLFCGVMAGECTEHPVIRSPQFRARLVGAIAAPKLCIYIFHLADAVCSCNIHDDHLCIASAQPLNEELVQLVGRVQWNPVAGIRNLLVAPPCFHELSRHLHAFTVEVVIV
jgi:hypothetical protein